MAKEVFSGDTKPGQPADIILKDGSLATGGVAIEPVSERLNATYLDELAFNEEKITIMVMETSDENAENPVTVGCNGVFRQFFRGKPTVTERKFVECLIVKSGRVSTPEFINNAGERAHRIVQNSAHRFPFTVISDPNPRGTAWLTQRLAEAY